MGDALFIVDSDAGNQMTTQVVGDLDGHAVHPAVVGHAVDGLAAVGLPNQIIVGLGGVEMQGGEGEAAAVTVFHRFDQIA